ncbi:hypothetical protein AUL38_09360 [Leucobacter sp. G161]|nr:hypothetical protein AUL38_09360 [Leucobacter sp. G161]
MGAAVAATLGMTMLSWVAPTASTMPAAQAAQAAPPALPAAKTRTLTYTGAPEDIVVPAGAESVTVVAAGGGGGDPMLGPVGSGGGGAIVTATFPVTPGETLVARVGGSGVEHTAGGYNGGAPGRHPGSRSSVIAGGAGGGASDLRQGGDTLEHRVLVAGGGGGGGRGEDPAEGAHITRALGGEGGTADTIGGTTHDTGAGMTLYGGAGTTLVTGCGGSDSGGGTEASGGAPGGACGYIGGEAGSLGQGGIPGYHQLPGDERDGGRHGGGGGGGYYGGGGGSPYGGGGGGSSYVGPTALPGASSEVAARWLPGHMKFTFNMEATQRLDVTVAPETIYADEESTTTVTATALGTSGAPIPGEIVTFTSDDPGQQLGATREHGDGTYSATLTSSKTVGTTTITARVGAGAQLREGSASLQQLPAQPVRIEIDHISATVLAGGKEKVVLTATFLDKYGRRATPVNGWSLSILGDDLGNAAMGGEQDGVATVTFRAGTRAGSTGYIIRAGEGVESDVFRWTQIAGSAADLTAELADPSLPADGVATTTVTAQLADAHGNAVLGDRLTVTASDPAVQIGSVENVGGGYYVADVTASTVAGEVTLTVTDTSVTPALTQTVTLKQLAGAAHTVTGVLADPQLVANGTSSTTLTITAADAHGNLLAGEAVTAVAADGATVGPVTDNGDGTYTATVTSSTRAGVAVITVTDSSVTPAVTSTVTLAQVAGPARSLTAELTEYFLPADGNSKTTVMLGLADRHGNPVVGATPTVMTLARGVTIGAVRDHGDGSYTAEVTTSTVAGDVVLLVSGGPGNDSASGQTTLTQFAGEIAGLTAQLADPQLVADGAASTTLTITAADAHGNPLSGEAITAGAAEGVTVGPVTDHGDGSYTATVTSSTRAGEAVITVTDSSVTPAVTSTVTLAQVAGPTHALTADLADAALLADGAASTVVTLRLADRHDNPIIGAAPTVMTLTPGVGIGAVQDHGDGTYTAVVTASATAGDALLLVSGGPGNTGVSTQLTLTQLAGPVDTLTAQLADARIVADGIASTTLTVTAADAHGNPLAGEAITAVAADGATVGPVTDHGDGSYTATVTSSTRAGDAVITVTDSSVTPALTSTVALAHVAGPAHALTADLAEYALPADGIASTALTLKLADLHGNPIVGANPTVMTLADGVKIGAVRDHGDGTYIASVTASTVAGDVLLLAAGGPGNAGLSTQVTLTQRAGAADTLTAQLADTRLVADGVAGTTLTVTAADVHGNPLTGQPITVTASDPRTRIYTVIDAGDGSYTAAIVSSFAAGAVTLTVTDTSVTPALTHTVELMQLAGEPEAATLTLDDTALPADGESSTTLEVGVVDAHGNPVIGARIGASSTDAGQQIGEPEEIAPGLYRVNVRASNTPGTSTLTVGTLEEQRAPGAARAARDAAEQTGFDRVLGTIDLEQQTVPVEPEEKPEPEKKPDPKPEPKPEPGNTPAQPTEPKTDPKLACSGAVAATLPLAGGALLLAAGAVLLLRLNGRRSARRSE